MPICVVCHKPLMITTLYKHYHQNCYTVCKDCYDSKLKDKIPMILPMSHKKEERNDQNRTNSKKTFNK